MASSALALAVHDHHRHSETLTPLLTRTQQAKYRFAIAVWGGLALWFWLWWFDPAHNLHTGRYILVTACLGWAFLLQVYFLTIFLGARKAPAQARLPRDMRVAMITTKTPSEPFALVRKTLEAMLEQDYPHDTWLADEDPSEMTIRWCRAHGVKISTRKGVLDYHRAEWPRRTRCKEGNLAYFYDHYGYDNYDIVSQLDSDHVPSQGYLRAVLRPFSDPDVGYVSAPSVCDSNARESWAARTRLYAEAMFHGALQAGYSRKGWAPMCIGSHYTVRTRALKAVGGLGPELAEDHSTSLILNAGGWRGVHAIDAEAHGAGPETFADMVTQEFQWSRSLTTLLLEHTPHYIGRLTPQLRFQFVFSQLWYPLFAVFMALMFMLPIWALLGDVRFADVTYPDFIGHAVLPTLVLIWIAYQIKGDGLFRPVNAKVIAWEKALFPCAQWPWVLYGCAMAVRDRLTGRFVDFRITPKGDSAVPILPIKVVAPYVLLAAVSVLPILLVTDVEDARGFYLFALVNAVIYTTLLIVILWHHFKLDLRVIFRAPARSGFQIAAVAMLVVLAIGAATSRGIESLYALNYGISQVQLVRAQSGISGAGQSAGVIRYRFDPRSNLGDRINPTASNKEFGQ